MTWQLEFRNFGSDLFARNRSGFGLQDELDFIGMILIKSNALLRIILFALLVQATLASASATEDFIFMGDSLYNLHDYKGSAGYYRSACLTDSSNFDSFWKLGRSLNLTGETAEKDSELAIFERARDAELHALSLDDNSADAHFQLARALGKIALHKGIFKSASLAKQVRKECQKALAIDSLHDGAWHILGRWHREVSKKPKILRIPMGLGEANREDALAFMRKAVDLNPENMNHHLEMGNTYRRYKMYDQAKAEYLKCLEMPVNDALDEKYRDEAKKSLAEMDEN